MLFPWFYKSKGHAGDQQINFSSATLCAFTLWTLLLF